MALSERPWSDFVPAAYTPAQWRAACLIDTGIGAFDVKSRYKLHVREPAGPLNRNGMAAAAAILAGARGGVIATADQKRRAARSLLALYRANQIQPPESLTQLAA